METKTSKKLIHALLTTILTTAFIRNSKNIAYWWYSKLYYINGYAFLFGLSSNDNRNITAVNLRVVRQSNGK